MSFAPSEAQYLLEGYGSGSPDTNVDEWDVVLVTQNGVKYLVARGFDDAVGPSGALDPSGRTAVVDVVSGADGGNVWLEVPDRDERMTVSEKRYAALMDDFDSMSRALDLQARIAAAESGSSSNTGTRSMGIHPLSQSPASSCGASSRTAAGALGRIAEGGRDGSTQAASTPSPSLANDWTATATHACPVQASDLSLSADDDTEHELRGTLGSVRGVKRFFERNRSVLASATKNGRAELLGLLRCIFGRVVTGVYLFGEAKVPTVGLAHFISSKGAALPESLLSKGLSMAPEIAKAAELAVGVWGGVDISEGVTSSEVLAGFSVAANHGMRIPFIGKGYVGVGVGFGYNATTQEWQEPEWRATAGDIPLSFGVEAGLGAFVTKGDGMGIFIDFDIGAGGADWGIEVDFSKSGAAAFLDSVMARSFVNGCREDEQ